MKRTLTRLLLIGWMAAGAASAGAATQFERFVGEYQGEALSHTDGEISTRDLRVKIVPEGEGFNVTWVAITRSASGKVKRKEYSISFSPSRREGIFRSAMRTDMFGQAVPLDPLKGDPYVWARIEGDTLTVYALLINDAGGYEMQTYHRTLMEGGLALEYSRVRDGEVLRTVTGVLRRL